MFSSQAKQFCLLLKKNISVSRKEIHDFFFRLALRFTSALKINIDHPLLIQIQDLLHRINADQKEIVFMWVPGHLGIGGNEAASRAAKEAVDKKPTADLMPFSDVKPLTDKYVYQIWVKE